MQSDVAEEDALARDLRLFIPLIEVLTIFSGSMSNRDAGFLAFPLEKLEIHFSLGAAPKRGSRFLSLRMEIIFRTSSVLSNFPTTTRYHVSFGVAFLRPVARSISIYNCNNFSGVMQPNIFIRHNNPQNINGKGKSKISF